MHRLIGTFSLSVMWDQATPGSTREQLQVNHLLILPILLLLMILTVFLILLLFTVYCSYLNPSSLLLHASNSLLHPGRGGKWARSMWSGMFQWGVPFLNHDTAESPELRSRISFRKFPKGKIPSKFSDRIIQKVNFFISKVALQSDHYSLAASCMDWHISPIVLGYNGRYNQKHVLYYPLNELLKWVKQCTLPSPWLPPGKQQPSWGGHLC